MSRTRLSLLAAAALAGAPGCFYGETINQRPSISIVPESDETVYRGSPVVLDSVYDDPESQPPGALLWRAYACTDATTPGGCDISPFYTGVLATASFTTPVMRVDQPVPVQALRVVLAASDDHGAAAKPDPLLLIPVSDAPPMIAKRVVSNYGFVVGAPIELYASVSDPDDGAAAVSPLDWVVFSPPTQPSYTLTDLGVIPQSDPTMIQTGKELTPTGTGMWSVQITATDPLGVMSAPAEIDMTVVDDEPPCIGAESPLAPPDGSSYPMTDPTLFQIPVVTDDLDVYPPQPNDPIKGVATFSWSILPPGATTRQALTDVTGNSVALDPATYSPGDIIELRVEISDRINEPVNCADSMSTCAINAAQPSCYQRLTWRIEAL